jgi:Protein of unknown function (DUF2924)
VFGNGGALGDACSVGFNPQSLGWWGHTILSALSGDSLDQLRKLWCGYFDTAPQHRSVDLLRRVLAWRIQADAYGGFDATTRRLLSRENSKLLTAPQPGMRLVRAWAGRRHEVVVLDGRIIYGGQTFGSLSAVARHITGQRWNGPRFFGLRGANAR